MFFVRECWLIVVYTSDSDSNSNNNNNSDVTTSRAFVSGIGACVFPCLLKFMSRVVCWWQQTHAWENMWYVQV